MAEKRYPDGPVGSASAAAAVVPSDANDVTLNGYYSRGLYVGGAGDVAVTMADGSVVTFAAVPAGTLLPVQASRVMATNTTATSIVALF